RTPKLAPGRRRRPPVRAELNPMSDVTDPSPWFVGPIEGPVPTPTAPTHLDPILRINEWSANGDMIFDMARLGYLGSDLVVFDPTWGKGAWWRRWRPTRLFGSDGNPAKSPGPPLDFRDTKFPDGAFDVVTFDPDYQSPGG